LNLIFRDKKRKKLIVQRVSSAYKNQHGRQNVDYYGGFWFAVRLFLRRRSHPMCRWKTWLSDLNVKWGKARYYSRIRNYVRDWAGVRKSLLNNELTSRLTREFFVRGERRLRQCRGCRDVNHLHEAVASDFWRLF